MVFSCWARLTGQRAWIKYEGHPFNPFLCNNLNQREDGRRKQQRYSKRSGCGRGSHHPGRGPRPAHTLGQMLRRCRNLGKKTECRPTTYRGSQKHSTGTSQPMSQTERRVSRNGSQGYTWEHQAGSNGRAFWSTRRPRDRSTPTSHRRHPCTARTPWAGPMPGPPSLCPKGKSSKSMPTACHGRRALTGTRAPQSRAGSEDGGRSRPAGLPHGARPGASVGVCLPHARDKPSTGCPYKASRGGRILFLLSRACPRPPIVPASESHS